MKYFFTIFSFILLSMSAFSQARLIINNGGIININGGTVATPIFLVVDNPNANAITRNTNGHIISEGEFNIVKWNIGTNNATYTMPFGMNTTDYLPISFTTTGAVGSGNMLLSTHSGNWKNSTYLPQDVLDFSHNSNPDNSAFVIDRFWRIEPQNYTTKPSFNNLILTYKDIEHTQASNTILESNLIAQRYNNMLNIWNDYIPSGSINIATNTFTVNAVPPNQQYRWWTLSDFTTILPISLSMFIVNCNNNTIELKWETLSETNNDYFVIEKSTDAIHFSHIATIPTQNGNSNIAQQYTFTDNNFNNTSTTYFRLKQIDTDGRFSYSTIVRSNCAGNESEKVTISIYPNPTTHLLNLNIHNLVGNKKYSIYNLEGREVLYNDLGTTETIQTSINVANLSKAMYLLKIDVDNHTHQVIKFIKE